MKKVILAVFVAIGSMMFVGCSTGKDIKLNQVKRIVKGRTTEAQIRQMFGEPTSVNIDYKKKRKTLIYGYSNSDTSGKMLAGAGTAVASAVLGPIGAIGGYLAANNTHARIESKTLTVIINMKTNRVIDYDFRVNQGRTSGTGIGSSIGSI